MVARCGCSSTTCACAVIGGTGVVVTGKGAASNPYRINIDAGKLTVDQTPTVHLNLHGSGTSADWYHLSATATVALDELDDVTAPTPAAGQVLAWDNVAKVWKPAPPSVAPVGAVNVSNGLSGDGSAGTPLVAKANAAGGIVVDGNGIGIQSGLLAQLSDSGWVETGYTRQAGAATITSFEIRMRGPRVDVICAGTLGQAIPASGSGDYGNINLVKVPSAYFPRFSQALGANLSGPNFAFGISTAGMVCLSGGPSGSAFSVGQSWSCSGNYLRD